MIIESQNPNLFPELSIPRSTALYWIHKSKSLFTNSVKLNGSEEYLSLKNELYQLKAEREILNRLLLKMLEGANLDALLLKDKKRFLVQLIDEMRGVLPITRSVQLLGIGLMQYYRWRIEVYGCHISKKHCDSRRPNQLSKLEQERLIALATDKKYAHMSTKSLMFYAQRNNLLNCCYDSWLRYLKINGVVRPSLKLKYKKLYRIGVRAKKPHELWHIDITELKLANNRKIYLQMIVDNYSRHIMSWSISDRKDLQLSMKTINKSLYTSEFTPTCLMSDGGGENRNLKVQRLLTGRGIQQTIAQSDIKFSNSMIEAVFRKLKQTTSFKNVKTDRGLKNKICKFVKQYNKISPHSKLAGACPEEMLLGTFNRENFIEEVKNKRELALKNRIRDYRQCRGCLTI